MDELYDVILIGLHSDIADRQASVKSIANLLGLDCAKIQHVVDNNFKAIVKHGVKLHDARRYQQQILHCGGVCDFRIITETGTKLELAPIELTSEDIVFVCPGCHYQEKVAKEAGLPVKCPQCGIIPSKYNKVAALKSEREMIKKRLLSEQQLREQQAKELEERQQREAHRKHLEDQLRKEMGLPKVVGSRFRRLSSMAVFWILGIGMGVGGTSLYFHLQSSSEYTPLSQGINSGTLNLSSLPQNLDLSSFPQQETLRQINAVPKAVEASVEVLDKEAQGKEVAGKEVQGKEVQGKEVQAKPVFDGAGQINWEGMHRLGDIQFSTVRLGSGISSPVETHSKPAPIDGNAILQEMRVDREWDLFLASEAERLIRLKQAGKATETAKAINSAELKFNTYRILAESYLASNHETEALKVFNLVMDSISGLPDVMKQAESLGWWSANLWKIGEKAKALQSQEAAAKLVSSLSESAKKAKSLASLASFQAQTEQMKLAQINFHQANELIQSISDTATKLHTYVHLARCYARSGNVDTASAILIMIVRQLNQLHSLEDRPSLASEITAVFADMGKADDALATLDILNTPMKEKMLFDLTRELAYTDQPFDAMKGLDKLANPEYQSRAAALLSLTTRYRSGSIALSITLQEKAIEALGQIDNPQIQAVVRGETARYLAHAGLNQEASDWAGKAIESAQSVKNPTERDLTFALLAANLARAKLASAANESVAEIKDAQLAEGTGKEIAGIKQIFSE